MPLSLVFWIDNNSLASTSECSLWLSVQVYVYSIPIGSTVLTYSIKPRYSRSKVGIS